MAAAAGLLNGAISEQSLAGTRVSPMEASNAATNGTGSTSGSSAGITANDFLTLLVTEMKNQDPTANTDPNEYINQLVNVNSLQQLISINETLTGALGSSTASAYTQPAATANHSAHIGNSATEAATTQNAKPSSGVTSASASDSTTKSIFGRLVNGNLSVPASQPAAERLAHALDGRTGMTFPK